MVCTPVCTKVCTRRSPVDSTHACMESNHVSTRTSTRANSGKGESTNTPLNFVVAESSGSGAKIYRLEPIIVYALKMSHASIVLQCSKI